MEKGLLMKTFFTKINVFIKTYLSISICTILSILLGVFCCFYLLSVQYPDNYIYHNFTTKALAKNISTSQNHHTISESFFLASNTKYKEKISAYETFYYYTSYQENISFSISSSCINKLNFTLLSDSGKKIPNKIIYSKKKCEISSNLKKPKQFQHVFLKLTNNSTSSFSICLLIKPSPVNKTSNQKTKQKEISKHKTLSKSKTSKTNSPTPQPTQLTTSNPQKNQKKKTLSTRNKENVYLNPHFLCMKLNSFNRISIKNYTQKQSNESFNWISTNPKVATIKNGKVYALSPGIAIIYIKSKKSSIGNSSCFIRVISNNE